MFNKRGAYMLFKIYQFFCGIIKRNTCRITDPVRPKICMAVGKGGEFETYAQAFAAIGCIEDKNHDISITQISPTVETCQLHI
jgi:hypothetical protein